MSYVKYFHGVKENVNVKMISTTFQIEQLAKYPANRVKDSMIFFGGKG